MNSVITVAHRTAETYSRVARFSSPRRYVLLLSDRLDDLCIVTGYPLPDIGAAFAQRERWPGQHRLELIDYGNPLCFLLERDHMTQHELAERSGVCRETINRICRGHTKPDVPTAVALTWALDRPLEALADLIDEFPIGPRSGEGVYA